MRLIQTREQAQEYVECLGQNFVLDLYPTSLDIVKISQIEAEKLIAGGYVVVYGTSIFTLTGQLINIISPFSSRAHVLESHAEYTRFLDFVSALWCYARQGLEVELDKRREIERVSKEPMSLFPWENAKKGPNGYYWEIP